VNLQFSNAFHDASARIKELQWKMQYADELRRFVLLPDYEEAIEERHIGELQLAVNAEKLFAACEEYDIPRIFIGTCELVTDLPDVRAKNGYDSLRTLIWRVKEKVATGTKFAAGCGNTNQTQTQNFEFYLEQKYKDKAWDVKTRKEISVESFKKYMVVSNHIKYRSEENA
jgi:hypothetical protein